MSRAGRAGAGEADAHRGGRCRSAVPSLILALLSLAACRSTYYSALESIGLEKRDLLVDRVEDAREAETEAKEQFEDALEQFRSVVAFDGGDLEREYDRLKRQYERSRERAEKVRERVESVEQVAEDLFDEWRDELDQYQSRELRSKSEAKLVATERRYRQLLRTMQRVVDQLDPVLETLEDQVLYLKHNLNARAIGSLRATASEIDLEVSGLLEDLEASIREADRFLEAFESVDG